LPDRLRIVLCLLMLLGTAGAGAQSVNQCIDRCFTTFSPSQMGGSTELRRECLENCNRQSAPRVQQGAIAFDPHSGAWGIAYGKASAGDAARSALTRCRENGGGGNCQLAASYADRCAAVAAVKSKARFTAAQGRSLAEAKAGALRACQTQVGGACELWVYGCAWDKN
jgi:hypothetical protein